MCVCVYICVDWGRERFSVANGSKLSIIIRPGNVSATEQLVSTLSISYTWATIRVLRPLHGSIK